MTKLTSWISDKIDIMNQSKYDIYNFGRVTNGEIFHSFKLKEKYLNYKIISITSIKKEKYLNYKIISITSLKKFSVTFNGKKIFEL